MQFYLFYPLLFFLACFDKKTPRRTLTTIISFLGVISLIVYLCTTDASQRFYYLPSRFFEFAAGSIVALVKKPNEKNHPFPKWFVYTCYSVMVALMIVNTETIMANMKLIAVVLLSVVLISQTTALENKVTGNQLVAKIGAVSYSLFVWHQVLLAFYRYCFSSQFSAAGYISLMAVVGVLSWMTYKFIEQKTNDWIRNDRSRRRFYAVTIITWIVLTCFAGLIYLRAGVVRDIPELYISKNDIHRGMHAEYVDRGFEYDKPFQTEKIHWYVIGNSFGRDFVNVILESPIADKVEISYSTDEDYNKNISRFKDANLVFLSLKGIDENFVSTVEHLMEMNGLNRCQLIIVGEKNFGESNGQVYSKRFKPYYFDQYVDVEDVERYINYNEYLSNKYGLRYINLMSMVTNNNNQVRVFTPDHHFISADCRHLSKGGAKYFANVIDWGKYLDIHINSVNNE